MNIICRASLVSGHISKDRLAVAAVALVRQAAWVYAVLAKHNWK